jgi:hypothetical protein
MDDRYSQDTMRRAASRRSNDHPVLSQSRTGDRLIGSFLSIVRHCAARSKSAPRDRAADRRVRRAGAPASINRNIEQEGESL